MLKEIIAGIILAVGSAEAQAQQGCKYHRVDLPDSSGGLTVHRVKEHFRGSEAKIPKKKEDCVWGNFYNDGRILGQYDIKFDDKRAKVTFNGMNNGEKVQGSFYIK